MGERIQIILTSPFVLFHSVTCYTNFVVSCIHVNTAKLHNITCTLVATGVIIRSLEYIMYVCMYVCMYHARGNSSQDATNGGWTHWHDEIEA